MPASPLIATSLLHQTPFLTFRKYVPTKSCSQLYVATRDGTISEPRGVTRSLKIHTSKRKLQSDVNCSESKDGRMIYQRYEEDKLETEIVTWEKREKIYDEEQSNKRIGCSIFSFLKRTTISRDYNTIYFIFYLYPTYKI
ncbi:hypothetical protein WA026_000855 [Henosepilachna vigintioctopunctata]|uniref:Uncharacterized protein n=1 Tax=Henosepilachna vigintioctopunctata TaxID=420089 RepID=A0AAW1UYZ7_9CUCU